MYQAIFCDIDGTLLTTDKRLLPDTIQKIREVSASGIPFILVTSRMPSGVYPILNRLSIKAPLICGGGAIVLNSDRQTVFETGLSMTEAAAIRCALPSPSPDFAYGTYSGDLWITDTPEHPEIIKEARITGEKPTGGDPNEVLPRHAVINKMLCMGKPELLNRTAKELTPRFPDVSFVKSAPHLLEIISGATKKSTAIALLCEKLDISPELSVAFGDNYNDIDMLKFVGLSVAMGNAPEPIKKAAVRVTDTNDREGVLKILNELF